MAAATADVAMVCEGESAGSAGAGLEHPANVIALTKTTILNVEFFTFPHNCLTRTAHLIAKSATPSFATRGTALGFVDSLTWRDGARGRMLTMPTACGAEFHRDGIDLPVRARRRQRRLRAAGLSVTTLKRWLAIDEHKESGTGRGFAESAEIRPSSRCCKEQPGRQWWLTRRELRLAITTWTEPDLQPQAKAMSPWKTHAHRI